MSSLSSWKWTDKCRWWVDRQQNYLQTRYLHHNDDFSIHRNVLSLNESTMLTINAYCNARFPFVFYHDQGIPMTDNDNDESGDNDNDDPGTPMTDNDDDDPRHCDPFILKGIKTEDHAAKCNCKGWTMIPGTIGYNVKTNEIIGITEDYALKILKLNNYLQNYDKSEWRASSARGPALNNLIGGAVQVLAYYDDVNQKFLFFAFKSSQIKIYCLRYDKIAEFRLKLVNTIKFDAQLFKANTAINIYKFNQYKLILIIPIRIIMISLSVSTLYELQNEFKFGLPTNRMFVYDCMRKTVMYFFRNGDIQTIKISKHGKILYHEKIYKSIIKLPNWYPPECEPKNIFWRFCITEKNPIRTVLLIYGFVRIYYPYAAIPTVLYQRVLKFYPRNRVLHILRGNGIHYAVNMTTDTEFFTLGSYY